MFAIENKGLRVLMKTAPAVSSDTVGIQSGKEGHKTSHLFPLVDSLDSLEEVLFRMMKDSVSKTYKRSKGWKKPIIWKKDCGKHYLKLSE
jgi:hypothetical protein